MSALIAAQVTAFPNGAPRSACASMAPIHMLFGAQDVEAPFSLLVSSPQANAGSFVTGNYNDSPGCKHVYYFCLLRNPLMAWG